MGQRSSWEDVQAKHGELGIIKLQQRFGQDAVFPAVGGAGLGDGEDGGDVEGWRWLFGAGPGVGCGALCCWGGDMEMELGRVEEDVFEALMTV